MLTLDILENHFFQYGAYYTFDISNLENIFDELRDVISKNALKNVYPLNLFEMDNNNLEFVLFDNNNLYIVNNIIYNKFDLNIIPRKDINKIKYCYSNSSTGKRCLEISIYHENKLLITLDSREYEKKEILIDCNETIKEFIKTI